MKPVRAIGWADVSDGDAALAERCGRGDDQACRELIDEHERMVYVLGYQLLGNHDEALELSQEVFLRVFRTIARFQGRSTLRTWIYRIVINSARNRQRWWGRWRACFVPLDPHIRSHGDPPAPTQSASPEQALSQKELADRVWRALATLPLEQRSAIILRELHGMHYAEIAFSLGVPTSAVKSRLSRARAALRKELRPR